MNKAIKISLWVTNIFFAILVIFSACLPWMVSWYVEVMHRSQTLATTILVTCYPCAPIAAALLLFLRKLIKNTQKEALISEKNITQLKKMSFCCIFIAIITLIAGKFYLPFLIVGATFAFLSLLLFTLKGLFEKELE